MAGLEAGADDYLAKAVRAGGAGRPHPRPGSAGHRPAAERLGYGDLTLSLDTAVAVRAGRTIPLTAREAQLLALLLRHPAQVLSREAAIAQIWDAAAVPNVVDRYVAHLRRKLGDPPIIHTVRGVGFMLR